MNFLFRTPQKYPRQKVAAAGRCRTTMALSTARTRLSLDCTCATHDRSGWRVAPDPPGSEICARSLGRFRLTPVGSNCRGPPYALDWQLTGARTLRPSVRGRSLRPSPFHLMSPETQPRSLPVGSINRAPTRRGCKQKGAAEQYSSVTSGAAPSFAAHQRLVRQGKVLGGILRGVRQVGNDGFGRTRRAQYELSAQRNFCPESGTVRLLGRPPDWT
jgi:hypothetical protein